MDGVVYMWTIKQIKDKLTLDTRGVFEDLGGYALQVVTFVIILALGALVLSTVRTNANVSANSNATLAIDRGLAGLADFSSWLSILVIVIIFAVILAMVYGFYRRSQ